jgi:hypothetical protein
MGPTHKNSYCLEFALDIRTLLLPANLRAEDWNLSLLKSPVKFIASYD